MKRFLLALTFVAALGAAGLGFSSKAAAGHGCYDDYRYGHYGYRSYPAFYSGWGYPSHYRSYYYPRHHHRHHGHGHRGHHHHHRGGVSFSIGF